MTLQSSYLQLLALGSKAIPCLQWTEGAELERPGGMLHADLLVVATSAAACTVLERCLQGSSQVIHSPLAWLILWLPFNGMAAIASSALRFRSSHRCRQCQSGTVMTRAGLSVV